MLREVDVTFTNDPPPRTDATAGRDVGAATRIPGQIDPAEVPWAVALGTPGAASADWVSLDLDGFQPAPQLRRTRGMVRDPRFHALLGRARVRMFVLSPQFTDGGDVVDPWIVRGSRSSTLRVLNLLRAIGPGGPRAGRPPG